MKKRATRKKGAKSSALKIEKPAKRSCEIWRTKTINGKTIDCLTTHKADETSFSTFGMKPMIHGGRLVCGSNGHWSAVYNYAKVATNLSVSHKTANMDGWEKGELKYQMQNVESLAYGFDKVKGLAEILNAKFHGKGDGYFRGDAVKVVEEISKNRRAECNFLVNAIEAPDSTAIDRIAEALKALWGVKHRMMQNESVIAAIGKAANLHKRIPFKGEARAQFNRWDLWRGGIDSPARWNQILKTVGFDWLPAAKAGRKPGIKIG